MPLQRWKPLRSLAGEYGVVHTSLGRYFARPDVAAQLKQAERSIRAEQRAADARWRAEQKAEREAQRRARQQQAAAKRNAAGRAPAAARRPEPAFRSETVRRGDGSASFSFAGPADGRMRFGFAKGSRASDPYAAWLDERDARVPLSRADLRRPVDDIAEAAVAAGGGMQAVIEATGLRSEKNVLALIDPGILERARENDTAAAAAPAEPAGPR